MSTSSSPTPDDAAWARVPEAARQHTAEGAEAFARFYLQQVNEAWMAPDPELIRPYALESCKTCANFDRTAESLMADGLRYDTSPAGLGPSIVMPESTEELTIVRVGQVQLAAKIIRADGTTEELMPRVPGESEVQLQWRGSAWAVAEVKDVQ